MGTEELKIRITLYSTMWDKPPHANIKINDQSLIRQDITGTEKKPDVLEFTHKFNEGEKHKLVIERSGKTKNQCIVNDNGDVLKDQLLHIKSIEIDEIDIGSLVFNGVYTPKYPEPWATQQRSKGQDLPESFKNVTSMGHDGKWEFDFESPFYMWLLENLY